MEEVEWDGGSGCVSRLIDPFGISVGKVAKVIR